LAIQNFCNRHGLFAEWLSAEHYVCSMTHFGFERAQWAASATRLLTDPEAAYDSPREGMVDDVLAHELRPGMSRAAVRAMLGPADRTDELEWYYDAGWRSIDPCTLVITFSKQGTVQHYEVSE
jgi:hypothetical protein